MTTSRVQPITLSFPTRVSSLILGVSLLCARCVARLCAVCRFPVPVCRFFRAPVGESTPAAAVGSSGAVVRTCPIEGDGVPTDQWDIAVEADLAAVELSGHVAVQANTHCGGGSG
jgi:hypothetical protein